MPESPSKTCPLKVGNWVAWNFIQNPDIFEIWLENPLYFDNQVENPTSFPFFIKKNERKPLNQSVNNFHFVLDPHKIFTKTRF